ncbi:docking protein 1b isoform X1 [Chiloscyllium plagiosum]|uniref:docking protein 1b isoform X1 n=1 Tax=Chiloscyllium plagiosum TaxID=36176 RepID=UPI001CB7B77E|nr:docking protein 1b isoform X1 [Chiloscyllium plagiosum]
MDKAIKEGQLYVLLLKFGKKHWKKNWFVLYPASQNGISRLEFYDSKDGANLSEKQATKKMDKKIIRLSDCISIAHIPSEVCPKESMSAFTIETAEKLYTFAAEKQTSADWVEKLCETAFPTPDPCCGANSKPLEMAENSIYYSRSEVNEFWVNVQKTEAAERCNLHGTYILKADKEKLTLKDTKSDQVLFNWPYKLLRRYGRDKVMFSFEAGRRCDSGAGNFTFETKHGNDIFLLVESSILEQKAQAEGIRRSLPPSEAGDHAALSSVERSPECPSLDASPALSSEVLVVVGTSSGGPAGSPDHKSGLTEGQATPHRKEQAPPRGAEEKELSKLLKNRSLPEPPAVGPPTPPRSPKMSASSSDLASVYSDPVDALTVGKCGSDCLYSEPVDSVPTCKPQEPAAWKGFKDRKAPGQRAEPLYADIYERVNQDFSRLAPGAGPAEEHIYDEPEGRAFQQVLEARAPYPLPPFTAIYDQAQLADSAAWRRKGCVAGHAGKDDGSGSPPPRAVEAQAAKPKKPKPLPAPKPTSGPFVKDRRADIKESGRELVNPERPTLKTNFNSSNNCIYSKVVKPKRLEKEVSVDDVNIKPESIYEDLGNL